MDDIASQFRKISFFYALCKLNVIKERRKEKKRGRSLFWRVPGSMYPFSFEKSLSFMHLSNPEKARERKRKRKGREGARVKTGL